MRISSKARKAVAVGMGGALAACMFAAPATINTTQQAVAGETAYGTAAQTASQSEDVATLLTVYANGKKVSKTGYLKIAKSGKDVRMVPLKATCKKLGAKVKKTKSAKALRVDTGEMHVRIVKGKNSYTYVTSNPKLVGMSAPTKLRSAPEVRNGVWYVPASMFKGLYGNAKGVVKTTGSKVWITAK